MTFSLIDDYDERFYLGYDLGELMMDQFHLNVKFYPSDYEYLYLYTLNKECLDCPYLRHCDNGNCFLNSSTSSVLNTNTKFRIATRNEEYLAQDQTDNVICDVDENFGQFGIYSLDVSKSCAVNTLKDPVNIYTPIITVLLIYLVTYLCVYGLCILWKKKISRAKGDVNGEKAPKKERILSLDTFRGIAIVIMIFANYGHGGYNILGHITWNGLHLSDLVFPWFVWIMGACIPLSLSSSFKKNIPNKNIVIKALIRSGKLFVLGIFLTGGYDLNYLRLFGVLQRIGIGYLFCTIIYIYFMKRSMDRSEHFILKELDDVLKVIYGWWIVLAIITVHTVIIFTLAAPGCQKGYLGPGGLHKNSSYRNCIGGAAGYIDKTILGNHMYQKPTIYAVYEAKPFDPEGILGCLTTIIQVFIGAQAGMILLTYKEHSARLIRWLMWAILTGLIGGALCGFSKEDGLIPVNKNLWSLSFVMVTSSLAYVLLSFCYVIVDVRKLWSGKPFLFAGMNAILLYIGHEMTDSHFPIRWSLHNDVMPDNFRRTHFLALLSDLWGVGMWVLISYYLYKIGYFFNL